MAVKVNMPKQGLQMTEGTIISWLVKEGDSINEGEPLFEMETDKLTIEIVSPATGTVLSIVRGEGEVVPITELIAIIGDKGEDFSDLLAETAADSGPSAKPGKSEPDPITNRSTREVAHQSSKGDRVFSSPRARWKAEEAGLDIDTIAGSGPDGLVIERDILSAQSSAPKATPLAQKAADNAGVDLSQVAGSGPRDKVYRRDVEAAGIAARSPAPREDRLVKLTGMRKVIAQRMRESLDTAAQAVHRIDVDMSEAVRLRSRLKEDEIAISFNDIILKTVAYALKMNPRMNSRLTRQGILEVGEINIGMAVAVDEGLLVPVIRNADQLPLMDIRTESRRLAEAARSNALTPQELQGSTFSVSNLGMFGLDSFTAIINRPDSGILAVGGVNEKAVVVDGDIVSRPICSLSLTYDHRVVDGAPAAEFLRDVKMLLENPYRLL